MNSSQVKYIIVGGGLSGLTAAYMLAQQGETDFLVLESRDRIGGRILTKDGVDLGATWFQNHHTTVLGVLEQLGLKTFYQYSAGRSVLVYSSMAPAHEFESDPTAPSAFRVAGGTKALVDALAASISEKIKVNSFVSEIQQTKKGAIVCTESECYEAEKVIITVPPRIATKIRYEPALSTSMLEAMTTTHTWMSNAIKVGIRFERPFWREKGMSGTLIGQAGAVTELYDHTCHLDKTFTLMGFVNEGLRELSPEQRKERIIEYIAKYLGEEVNDYLSYEEKDWSQDSHTSCTNLHSVYISPQYGKPQFQQPYMDGTLLFAGAETATVYGGYMDGALRSAIEAVRKLTGFQE